jgi:endoglucanase
MTFSSCRLCSILFLLLMTSSTELFSAGSRVAVVNQLGYPRQFGKSVFASQAADSFRVEVIATGEKVFRGPMLLWKSADGATGRTVYRGDFSGLRQAGQYRVVTSHGDTSSPFAISDSVYDPVFRKALKGFYFQRCGMALLAAYAGAYQHASCHALDGVFHTSADTSGFHLATGGWHDAGDYGKYVVNAGISTGTLLLAYDMFPSCFNSDDLGIPESGNGVPDILDEVRYELEWFLTMQRSDGAFWFKITHPQFEGFVMPQNDTGARNIYAVSSTATADAVAVLARAARTYATIDATFAQKCLDAATLGWQFLTAHGDIVPTGGFKNPSGTATGEYGDANDTDERLWAAAELFETTGNSAYDDYFQGGLLYGSQFTQTMSWPYVRPLGLLTYLRSKQSGASSAVRGDLRTSLLSYCSSQATRRNSSGYRTVLLPGDYVWGSNSVALNVAVLLLAGVAETGDTSYVAAAADQLHYVLGVNALSRSFVTGLGENPPKQPHHRPSASDGVADPVPGLIVGGPEQYRSDAILQALYTSSTPPALVYADSLPSYASNEICINWNAPLVFVAGYFRGVSGPVGVTEENPQLPAGFVLEQNYPNPFNPKTVVSYQLPALSGVEGSVVSEVRLGVYDLLGREVALLVNERKAPGTYEVLFDGTNLSSGVYICRLNAGKYVESRKMMLTK